MSNPALNSMASTTRPTNDNLKPALKAKNAHQLMKTELCKFFMVNRCGKGSGCVFAHSLSEIREKPNLNKTSMCRSFLQSGNCDDPTCSFAHSERDLRTTKSFFKTKMCRFAGSGQCKHGAGCRFAHNPNEINQENFPGLVGTRDKDNHDRRHIGHEDTGTEYDQSENDCNWDYQQSDQSTIPSDLSTRADTNTSVLTPEGSSDSGQDDPGMRRLPFDQYAPRRGGDRRSGTDRNAGRSCTTLMMINVPNFFTQGALVSLLEDLSNFMRGAFDFFYCPWDPFEDRNLGYAIINFFSKDVASAFEMRWNNQPLLPRAHGAKRLGIVSAALQGRAANLRHFSGFSLAHHEDPHFRPLVRAGPSEILRPMAIAKEFEEEQRKRCGQGNAQNASAEGQQSQQLQCQQLQSQQQTADHLMNNIITDFRGLNMNPQRVMPSRGLVDVKDSMAPAAMLQGNVWPGNNMQNMVSNNNFVQMCPVFQCR